MIALRRIATMAVGLLLSMTGCGGSTTSSPAAGGSLTVSPMSYAFPLDNNSPAPFAVTSSGGSLSGLSLAVADPTIVGITAPAIGATSATFSVTPIARGSTTVTATDTAGGSASVSVSTALCGRPASLVGAQQVVPASGAANVATTIGVLYFIVYFATNTPGNGNLHLAAGAHGTLEGGPLAPATLPPGTVLPTPLPIPFATSQVVSATVPALQPGQQYRTQLYNDTCQPAVLAGSFST